MRVENAKVKLTIPIPVDRPNNNGVIYTKDAIENAVNNFRTNLPIVYGDDEADKKVIGTTIGNSHIVTWDFENQICKMTVDGVIFYSGADIIVDKIENDKITDFEIVSIGLSK